MPRLVLFNHKGGVGKTTLTMNIASALIERGKRILLIDTDPQCNLTAHLVDSEQVDLLLDESDSANGKTIWTAVRPVAEGTGAITQVDPVKIRNGLYLVPGDIQLSEYESELSEFWSQSILRKPRGLAGTTAISRLVDLVASRIKADFVFYDAGPNIGALNRVILLDADYFIVPVACDVFSARAPKTLGRTLEAWITQWEAIAELAPLKSPLLPGRPSFLGYIPQNFRVYGGEIAGDYATLLARIDKEINEQIYKLLASIGNDLVPPRKQALNLGGVKNYGVLIPTSQNERVPIWGCSKGTPEQRTAAKVDFERITARIMQLK